jgi:hypothetical protein
MTDPVTPALGRIPDIFRGMIILKCIWDEPIDRVSIST